MSGNLIVLQEEFNELNSLGILNQDQHDRKNWLENKIGEYKAEIEAQAVEQAEREKEIEEKVASIELPYDFNDLYENSTANATIIEIVQQFKRQDLVEHNAEIEKLKQLHKESDRAADERELQLQRQNEAMQVDLRVAHDANEGMRSENDNWRQYISKLEFDLQDVKQSRDNAAAQIEEQKKEVERLNSHVDDLLKEQALGAKEAHKVIETNQTLNQLIEKAHAEKQAKIKSSAELAADGALGFRGKVELPSIEQQELPHSEVATSDTGNAQDMATYEASTVEAHTFPTIQAPPLGLPMAQGPSNSSGEGDQTPATQEWVKEQITQAMAEIRGAA